MNIAIIEKGHFEVAYTLISLFDNGDNRITVFVDESSFDQLAWLLKDKIARYTWIKQTNESNRDFIEKMFRHIHQHSFDLLYFDTIADNFIHYAWYIRKLNREKIIMTLHDINGFFHYTPSWSLRKTLRYIGKRRLIRLIPAFNVLSETLIPHLRQKIAREKKIFNIAGGFFEPGNFKVKEYKATDTINITIPGSVDTRRRDYDSVFELLLKAKQQGINISITLLGTFRQKYSEHIHTKCLQYIGANNNLHLYETGIVNQAEFDRVMSETHFIWMPLQSSAIVTDGTTEQYGISISSGNIGDVIRYVIPFFAPAHFKSDSALQKSRYQYNEITDIINTLKNLGSIEYERLQDEAFKASLNYTKDSIIARNQSLFQR
ncbi:MAG: hypothetical protein WDO19_28555 [Bacteroidota bacterium]